MELSRFMVAYPGAAPHDPQLLYSTLRGAVVQLSAEQVAALQSGTLADAEQQTLARLGFLVPDAAAEHRQVTGYFNWVNATSRRFVALVTLNLDCNLACPYCYEDHFRGKSYMSDETADLLVSTILNGPMLRGDEVLLDFYGGEALLSTRLIRRIAQPLQEAAARNGTPFSFTLVTNGTLLTPQIVAELQPLGLSGARITIDGPPDIHNVQRPFVSGLGSFDAIMKNLKAVCGMIKVQLGSNYTRANYHRFPELLDILTKQGITPEMLYMVQFSPVIPSAGEAGMGDFAMGCACANEPWLIEASLHLRGEILSRGWNTPKPKLAGCMVEFANDLVVAWDGSLYKCPAFMGWRDLQIGTLAEGVKNYHDSHQMNVWKCDECSACAYLPLCFGGCRFMQRLRSGAIDGIDCRKHYFDEALERIVRQDIELRKR